MEYPGYTLIEVLPLCICAVGVFYRLSRVGYHKRVLWAAQSRKLHDLVKVEILIKLLVFESINISFHYMNILALVTFTSITNRCAHTQAHAQGYRYLNWKYRKIIQTIPSYYVMFTETGKETRPKTLGLSIRRLFTRQCLPV